MINSLTLSDIRNALGSVLLQDYCPCRPREDFLSLTNDSRKVDVGSVFVAIAGSAADGHRFIPDVIKSGASAVVCERMPERMNACSTGVHFLVVSDSYLAYALLAELFKGYPAKNLKLCGITGTNGKTTTTYILNEIIASALQTPCGLISTVEYRTGKQIFEADRTTPDPIKLQQLFDEMKNAGCSHCVMEVSSHSLDQKRTGTVKFEVAIFTNLTGDHLDYHRDMDSYFRAKKLLFEKHLADKKAGIVNIDDEYGQRLLDELGDNSRLFSFGTGEGADFRIANLAHSTEGISFSLTTPDNEKIEINSELCGRFNAYNIAAAAAAARSLGIDPQLVACGIRNMKAVPGRMHKVIASPLVFVDYAHTDDALANVLSTLSELCNGRRIIVVFGCGGDRDATKRPRMGAVAAKFANRIYVTSDNPRTENPDKIIGDIVSGIPDSADFEVITDRKSAIFAALDYASDNDIVLIAGKGHENYQEINGVKFPFDDTAVVKEWERANEKKNK